MTPRRKRASSRKRTLTRIQSLEQVVAEHEAKIAHEPQSPSVQHWQKEIATAEAAIRKVERRLKR